jgi:hypothetical protein
LADEIKKVERERRGVRGEKGGRGAVVNKILLELADQIGRAARSPKSNIVEGWKRNSTKEYFDFLGFSIGSTEEINEDCSDIIKGKYKELMGVRGIMGVMGFTDYLTPSTLSNPLAPLHPLTPSILSDPLAPLHPLTPSILSDPLAPLHPLTPFTLEEVEALPFYPLNPAHPLVVRIKLRCKELLMLLNKLQKSLDDKMSVSGELPLREKLKRREQQRKEEDEWIKKVMEELKDKRGKGV